MCVCGGVCVLVAAGAMGGGAFGSAACAKKLGEGDTGEAAPAEAGNSGIGELCAKMTALKMSVQQSALRIARERGLAKGSRRRVAGTEEENGSEEMLPGDGETGNSDGDLWGACRLPWVDVPRRSSRVIKTKRVEDCRGRRRGSNHFANVLEDKHGAVFVALLLWCRRSRKTRILFSAGRAGGSGAPRRGVLMQLVTATRIPVHQCCPVIAAGLRCTPNA